MLSFQRPLPTALSTSHLKKFFAGYGSEKTKNKNLDKVFDSRPSPGVDNVGPMPIRVDGQLLVALHKQDARIADLSGPSRAGGGESEASLEEVFVLVARREPRAARLRPADAAAAD